MLRGPVSQSAGPGPGNMDPITGLEVTEARSIQASPLPLPSPATRLAPEGPCSTDQWGSSVHLRHSFDCIAAWWWCGWERLGSEDGVGWGQLWWSQENQGSVCLAWGVSWAHLSPGGGQGDSKGQSQGGQANPRGTWRTRSRWLLPRGAGATACGDGFGPSQPKPPTGSPASARGEINC